MNNQDYEVFLLARSYADREEYAKAVELLELLSRKGNRKAIFELALLYCRFQPEIHLHKAVNLFTLAGELGYPESYYYLGKIYYERKEYAEAYRFFERGKKKAESHLYLGKIALEAQVKNVSKRVAFVNFLEGSKRRVYECDYYLAICYRFGYGIRKDDEKAEYYLKRAMAHRIDDSYHLLKN